MTNLFFQELFPAFLVHILPNILTSFSTSGTLNYLLFKSDHRPTWNILISHQFSSTHPSPLPIQQLWTGFALVHFSLVGRYQGTDAKWALSIIGWAGRHKDGTSHKRTRCGLFTIIWKSTSASSPVHRWYKKYFAHKDIFLDFFIGAVLPLKDKDPFNHPLIFGGLPNWPNVTDLHEQPLELQSRECVWDVDI